jgi:hypothetical protein
MPKLPLFQEDPKAKPLRFLDFTPGQIAWNYGRFTYQRGTIYVMECQGFHKIGMTPKNDVEGRRKDLQVGNPFPIRIVDRRTAPLAGLAYAESWLHHKFDDRQALGEWFAVGWDEIEPALKDALLRANAYGQALSGLRSARAGAGDHEPIPR